MAPHSSTLAWKIPWTGMEEPGRLTVPGVAKSRMRLSNFTFTFRFHALEKKMATRSSVLAWRIPGSEEPGGLQSMGSRTRLSDFTFTFRFHALEKEMAAHSSVLAWRTQGWGSWVGCHLWGHTESDMTEVT